MFGTRSHLGTTAGVMMTACVAALAGCAPTPITRTVSTEQVTTTTPPPPAPPMITTTTTEDVTPVHSNPGRRLASARHRSDWADDVDEETTETIVPAVPAQPRTMTTTTTTQSTTGN